MAQTRAQKIRATRQDELREYLSARGLVQHVVDLADKMEGLDGSSEDAQFELQKLKQSADTRLKLIGKYLPDLKAVEFDGALDVDATVQRVEREIIDPKHDTQP